MINGEAHSWESITVKGPHGTMYDITNITFKDKRPVNRLNGKGSRTRAYSRGPQEGDGELEMRLEEYQALSKALKTGVYAGKPFEVTVSYAKSDGPTYTIVLQQCLFESRDWGSKVDDESVMVKMGFQILGDIVTGGQNPFPVTR